MTFLRYNGRRLILLGLSLLLSAFINISLFAQDSTPAAMGTTTTVAATDATVSGPIDTVNEATEATSEVFQPIWNAKYKIMSGISLDAVNDTRYYGVILKPALRVGPFLVAADLSFQLKEDFSFRSEQWNSVGDVLGKIEQLSYIDYRNRPFFLQIGHVTDFSLGHGSIIQNYSNQIFYPEIKNVGFRFDVDYKWIGGQSFIASLADFNLMGFRAFFRPFHLYKSLAIPVQFRNLEIGVTYVVDRNPASGYVVVDTLDASSGKVVTRDQSYISGTSPLPIQEYGIDIDTRVMYDTRIILHAFIDFVHFDIGGSVLEYGVWGNIYPTTYNIEYALKLRNGFGQGSPPYFNSFYDVNRYTKWSDITNTSTYPKDQIFFDWSLMLSKTWLKDRISTTILAENFMSTATVNHLMFKLELTGAIEGIVFRLIWDKQNISDFWDIFKVGYGQSNTMMLLEAGFEMSEFSHVLISYRKTFMPRVDGADTNTTPDMDDLDYIGIETRLFF